MFITFQYHVLTFVSPHIAVLANVVTFVVNCYDVTHTIPQCCKCDMRENYYEEEFVRIRIFELLYMKQYVIPYCLPTLYQIQQYYILNNIIKY